MVLLINSILVVLLAMSAVTILILRDERNRHQPANINDLELHLGPFGTVVERDNPEGLITYIKDSYGNEHWYTYDKFNRLIRYKNSEGIDLNYTYKKGKRIRKRQNKRLA